MPPIYLNGYIPLSVEHTRSKIPELMRREGPIIPNTNPPTGKIVRVLKRNPVLCSGKVEQPSKVAKSVMSDSVMLERLSTVSPKHRWPISAYATRDSRKTTRKFTRSYPAPCTVLTNAPRRGWNDVAVNVRYRSVQLPGTGQVASTHSYSGGGTRSDAEGLA